MKIQDVNGDGVALSGIDPVSQAEGNPLRGQSGISFSIGKTTYYFDNEDNKRKFTENPENYLRAPNTLATTEMVGAVKEKGIDEEESRWKSTTKNIGDNDLAARSNATDTPPDA